MVLKDLLVLDPLEVLRARQALTVQSVRNPLWFQGFQEILEDLAVPVVLAVRYFLALPEDQDLQMHLLVQEIPRVLLVRQDQLIQEDLASHCFLMVLMVHLDQQGLGVQKVRLVLQGLGVPGVQRIQKLQLTR